MKRLFTTTLLVVLGACSKSEPPAPTAAAPPSAAPAPSTPTASAATPLPSASAAGTVEIPVEEDFEDEASEKVNAQTLDAQLDALEREIKAN